MSASNDIYDVAIIGAGVMGSSAAYYLSKTTNNVILLEQFDFLHRKGSSHGDSRIIRLTYAQDYYTELMLSSYKLWYEVEKDSGTKVFTKTGGLDFGREANADIQSLIQAAQKYKVRHDILKPTALSKKFPTIHMPEGYIAIYSPSSGILNATKAVATFQSLAKARGVTLRDNCKIVGISKKLQYTELITASGEIVRARKVIFTTGAWTKKIFKEYLNIDLPLTPVQTTIAYWKVNESKAKATDYSSINFPVFINYEHPMVYGTPAHEYPNMIKCAAHDGPRCDPDQRTFLPEKFSLESTVQPFLRDFFQGIEPQPGMTESCMYTWSPDQDFIIDRVPKSGGSWFVGCGFSGHGFKLAPIVGKSLAEFVSKGNCSFPRVQKHFSIDRFNPVSGNNSKM